MQDLAGCDYFQTSVVFQSLDICKVVGGIPSFFDDGFIVDILREILNLTPASADVKRSAFYGQLGAMVMFLISADNKIG